MKCTVVANLEPLRRLVPRAVRAAELASEEEARDLAELQRDAILSGRTPTGGAQKRNAAETIAEKRETRALLDTGRLSSPGAWRVARTARGVSLRPPADRVRVLRHLKRRGYRTILDGVPASARAKLRDAWRRAWKAGG